MQREIVQILKDVAEEEGLPYSTVEKVYLSQFKFAKEEIKKSVRGKPETFKNIRFPFLGSLQTNEARIIKIYEECKDKTPYREKKKE